jgi:two-component system OmpR family response regulator
MDSKDGITVYPLDVYAVTEKGQEEFKRGSTTLTAAQLGLLMSIDGKATVRELAERAGTVPEYEIKALMRGLIRQQLVAMSTIADQEKLDFSYFFNADKAAPEPTPEAKQQAQKEAETGEPALQRDGYYVSIARKASAPRKPASGRDLSVLAVEDDPELLELLRRMLRLQGFAPRVARNREEVIAALRQVPSPDLVLLDVMLPDANGFDILFRMKQHPALKNIPVIMLTGVSTPESIMRGLAGGADGYVTKPFELENLLNGIRSVLGIA